MSKISDTSPQSTLLGDVSPPTTYKIGRRQTEPLVQARHLRGHLALLHAFDTLRRDVQYEDTSRFPPDARAMNAETRWAWFVSLAVERFQRWCEAIHNVQAGTLKMKLPPIDVVMVWHAYLLNPIWYAEDTTRVPTLTSLPQYTEYLTTHLASPHLLLANPPDASRVRFWQDLTLIPYDPFDSARLLKTITLRCPHCQSSMEVPILAPDGKGYAQSKFTAKCSSCRGKVTKELLGLYKFAKDIVREDGDGPVAYLAGTLHSRDKRKDTRRASVIKSRVRSRIKVYSTWSPASRNPPVANDVMQAFNYDPSKFSRTLKDFLLDRIANRILRAYSDDRPFSIELVGAVLRQGSFVCKMADLGWTQPEFVSEKEGTIVLEHCVTRYHAFLNLIAGSPGTFFVPTLDIDLAWHTHQLMAVRYQKDCKKLVGRYVDHDDKVEENHLATAFDVTCRAWIDEYKVPYTHCGCPHPGTTFAQRLRRVFEGKHDTNVALQPPDPATPGTHPSDHNAIFPMHRHRSSMYTRERRREKAGRRRAREAGKGRLDSKVADDNVRLQASARDHPEPFLYPVPLYYTPFGGCVVGVGGVVDGDSAYSGAQCASGIGGSCGFGAAGCGGSTCGGGAGATNGGGGGGCGGGCGGGG